MDYESSSVEYLDIIYTHQTTGGPDNFFNWLGTFYIIWGVLSHLHDYDMAHTANILIYNINLHKLYDIIITLYNIMYCIFYIYYYL